MRTYRPMYPRAIWIDPAYLDRYGWPAPWGYRETKTITTDHTTPYVPPGPAPVDEERIRRIVREEIGDLPIPFDVPDAPPEDGSDHA